MAASDEVLIRIRAAGGKAAAKDIQAARRELDQLGRTSRSAGGMARGALGQIATGVRGVGSSLATTAGDVGKFAAAASTLAGAGLAVQAVKTGAAYNKMQDSQMVAFSTMLRSESKAKDLMADIQALSLKSPVLDPGSTGKSVQLLLNYGMTAKNALPLVEALGDASAASGKSIAEVMPQAALALGQIEGKGKLSAEELNQLTEAVGINRKRLAKELGLTSEEFQETFKPGKQIEADKAIPAIQRALEYGSEGAAKKLSKTTAGQVDQLKEIMSRELGKMTRPWYDAAGDTAGGISKILGRKDLTGGQKVRMSIDVAKEQFGPLVKNARQAFKESGIGKDIADGIEKYTPIMITKLGNALAAAAPKVASAFLNGFLAMGPWGQALTVGFLLKKFGAFGPAGTILGRILGRNAGKSAAASTAAGLTADGAITGKSKGRMQSIGRSLGGVLGPAMAAVAINQFAHEMGGAGVQDILRKLKEGMGLGGGGGSPGQGTKYANPGQISSDEARRRGLSEAYLAANTEAMSYIKRGMAVPADVAKKQKDAYAAMQKAKGRFAGGVRRPGETTLVGERGPEVLDGNRVMPASSAWSKRASRPQRTGTSAVAGPGQSGSRMLHSTIVIDGKAILKAVSTAHEREALAF